MKAYIFKQLIYCTLILAVSGLPLTLSAQSTNDGQRPDDPEKKEKIEALKVAFISQQIDLTTAEAEKFWPIYNEFNTKRDEFAKAKKQVMQEARKNGLENITDQQAEEILNADLKFEQQVLDLKKEYVEKYKAVIGIKKTAKFFQSEKEFNNFLLKQLKESGKPPKP